MHLNTHCPRCATAFLVTQEQLGEAQGWVRCGMCQEVFIAQAHTATPPQTLELDAPLPHQQEAVHSDAPETREDGAPGSAAQGPNRPAPRQSPVKRPTPSPAMPRTRTQAGPWVVGTLLVLLALQIGLQERHSWVSAFPQATAWLQSLCTAGRCGLRQISAVVIEDASFSTSGPALFHLSATVSNRSKLTLDAPSLLLTLSDASDQVLARKVYAPQDWGAKTTTLPGAAGVPASLWIQWDDAASTQRVVGYRLQAFYP